MCASVLPVYRHMHHVWCPVPTEVPSPGTSVLNSCGPSCGCWESYAGPQQEHVLLTAKPSLQSLVQLSLMKPGSNEMKESVRRLERGLESTGCSCTGPGLSSQHPHGGSPPSVTPLLGDLMSSLASSGTRHTCGTEIHIADKTYTHIIINPFSKIIGDDGI